MSNINYQLRFLKHADPSSLPVVAPDGMVYAAASDDCVYALRAKDGSTVWSKTAPGARVLGGAGNGLFVVNRAPTTIPMTIGRG